VPLTSLTSYNHQWTVQVLTKTNDTMDLIQKFTLSALLVLIIVTTGMLIQNHMSVINSPVDTANPQLDLQKIYQQKIADNDILYASVVDFLKQKQFSQADAKLLEIEVSTPNNPQSLIYRAKLQYGLGESALAIHSYRLAIEKSPDYIDKKTPLYMGDEIMDIISEARSKLLREKKLKPGDTSIDIAIEDIYYLQRRIAGGCE